MRLRPRLVTSAAALAVAAGLLSPPAAQAAGVRVYPLGDSITYGATYTLKRPAGAPTQVPAQTVVSTPGGYRTPLTGLLTATGIEHEFVGTSTQNSNAALDALGQNRHNGHPGFRIDQVSNALDGRSGSGNDLGGYWLSGGTGGGIFPDVAIVHLGTNDIYQHYDPLVPGRANLANATQRATFVAHAGDRLQALVDKIQALRPGIRIVLSNVVPLVLPTYDVVVVDYNARVAAIAAGERARGERVAFADVWSSFAVQAPTGEIVVVPGLVSPDNAHPTPPGYALMARVYRDGVQAALALP
ncbi:MAG TPA: GDSL-type esterase/lipase family protein [Frankiaceae bacterium]|nr:GDSL-type esterase/lipase family protein [Frankiaceae bacterium]